MKSKTGWGRFDHSPNSPKLGDILNHIDITYHYRALEFLLVFFLLYAGGFKQFFPEAK
jgi:hypothetical protein